MLKRLMKNFRYGKKGFTLIELLVVVAILGVLAAVAIPNVSKFIGSGQSQADATELANVQTAVTAYMADAQIGSIGTAATTLSASSNISTVVNSTTYTVGDYIQGGISKLSGTYTVSPDGSVSVSTSS